MTRAGRAMVGTLAVVVALALSACGKSVTSGGASGGGSAAGNDAVETNFGEMGQLSKQGVLADYRGAAFASVPESGRFPGWLADRLNIMLPAWNTKLIKPGQEPRSWEDLADPRYKGKLTLELTDSDWYENVTKSWLRHG